MWSIGVIFLTVLTKMYPFFHSTDDQEAIVEIANIFGHDNMVKAGALYGINNTNTLKGLYLLIRFRSCLA